MGIQTIFYCESNGQSLVLEGSKLEAFYCCTESNEVCFCWIKVQDQEPYRFFVENANACFFEQFPLEEYQDEIDDFKENNELIDLVDKLHLKDKTLGRVHIDCDEENFSYIRLCIEFKSGDVFVLQDKDQTGGEEVSHILYKSQNSSQEKQII